MATSVSPVTRWDESFFDYVASGCVWTGDAYASTRAASMTSGVVYIDGKRLIGLSMNVEYKALAAEGKPAHGLSPILAILDEIEQVVGTKDSSINVYVVTYYPTTSRYIPLHTFLNC